MYQVLTEFLRKVFWSGPHNTIVAPAGHHIMEGRWLRDDTIIDDYARFWRTRLGGSAVLGAPQLATLAVCLLALLAGYGWRCAPWRRSDRAAQGPMRGCGATVRSGRSRRIAVHVQAAHVLGDPALEKRFEACSAAIHRGVPFANSLYV